MKMNKLIKKKPLKVFCNMLIALAPLALVETACFLVWGEPNCPDELRELYSAD